MAFSKIKSLTSTLASGSVFKQRRIRIWIQQLSVYLRFNTDPDPKSCSELTLKSVFGIRISLHADPDPVFYLNADPDPDADPDADPDSGFWIFDPQPSF